MLIGVLLLAPLAWPQGLEYIKANYTKYEYRIPMRDGKRLFTAVYVPKDSTKSYPFLMQRTPYSVRPYGPDLYRDSFGGSEKFAREGFIFVYQDVRGRWRSEGEFTHVTPHKPVKRGPADVDESTDTYDTIEWLVKNIPNNNGRVGLLGISYPGFYAAAGMIDTHPALKAVSPQAPVLEWFIGDDFRHNGAFYLTHAFNFLAGFTRPYPEPGGFQPGQFDAGTQDGYRFFLEGGTLQQMRDKYFGDEVAYFDELMRNDTYNEYWKMRNLLPHLKNISAAVMTVGGWFDAEDLYGPLHVYKTVEQQNPSTANMLVMGPWFHGGWWRSDGDQLGNVRFNSKTSVFYREEIEFPFFDYHLKGNGQINLPEAFIFETGANVWRRFEAWPPAQATPRTFYFQADGELGPDRPTAGDAFDEYLSDPAKPVPYIPGIALRMTREHMTDDQRFASTRPDVLVYRSGVLEEDVTIAGPIVADLYVSTTGTDSDFVVKLIDVYPDDYPNPDPNPAGLQMGGYQQLVRGEPFRGKFRNSFERPEPFTPGKVEQVRFTLPDAAHTFRRGHRIMVQVQSSWFPLVDRNPQKFVSIGSAKPEAFQKATQRVYRSAGQASSVQLSILP
jgi:putative CocE/NonD family hydrolase